VNKISAPSLLLDPSGDFIQYGEQNVRSNNKRERTSKVQGRREESWDSEDLGSVWSTITELLWE